MRIEYFGSPEERSDFSAHFKTLERDDELRALGKENLGFIIAQIRRDEAWATKSIGHTHERLTALRNMAETAEYGIDRDNLVKPIRLDEAEAAYFAAHFVLFGRSGFSHCGLCPHHDWSQLDRVHCVYTDRVYPKEASCAVLALPSKEASAINGRIQEELQKQRAARQTTRARINRLLRLKHEAPSRPIFTSWRPFEKDRSHFATGDRVVVYAYSPAVRTTGSNAYEKWVYGTLLGTRVVLDQPLFGSPVNTTTSDLELARVPSKRVWSVPWGSPFILHAREFDLLAQLPRNDLFRILWLKDANRAWSLYDPASKSTVVPRFNRFENRLAMKYLVPPAPVGERLMGANEACELLEYAEPPSEQRILTNWADFVKAGGIPTEEQRRARDMLLARVRTYLPPVDHGGPF